MIGELEALPHPENGAGTLLQAIDLVVPHQANMHMVVSLAQAAGIPPERLFFNIDRVGNTSPPASSWPSGTRFARGGSTAPCGCLPPDSAPAPWAGTW
jgi:hypothetical protein